MFIIYILFVAIIGILFYDFKKGVLLYAPMKLFFNLNVRFGSFTFDFLMSLIIVILFLNKWRKFRTTKFPFAKAFLIYGIGYTITCFIPSFVPNFIPRIILMVLLFSFVYYYCLDSIENVKFAIICYALFTIILCGNGLLTPLFNINPLDDFLQSVSDKDNSIFMDNALIRMGQVRYRSFIPHAISYGVACCVILYLMLWSLLQIKNFIPLFLLITIGLLFSGIVISGSRTPILGLIPILFLFLTGNHMTLKMKFITLLIIGVFLLIRGEYLYYLIYSIIDSQAAFDASGSSSEMRITQYAIGWKFFISSPIWGMGMDFNPFKINNDINGAESVWLPLLINNGIIGILSYAIIYWYLYKISYKNTGRTFLFIMVTGWLMMRTATSLIGVTDAQFFAIFFCVYRYYELKGRKVLIK